METTIGSRSGLDFDQQRREIRNLRKLALVISLTASQILIIFPLFVCAKIYLYHELHWTWLVILPQISAALWLLLVPFHARLQGFLLLSTPSFVCLALQSPNTYWGCHAALFPFFLSLLGSKKVPLGLIVSLQLHLEGLLALFHNPNLVSFPIWPSPLGITTFILMTLGTIILPLAVLSVAYLTHQATKTMLTIATSWVTLCTFLSFDAVNRELVIPFYLYATFVVWIGACVTLDGLLVCSYSLSTWRLCGILQVYVAWRTRLSRIVGSFIPEPALDPPPSRIARARGLANREIRELPIMVNLWTWDTFPFAVCFFLCPWFSRYRLSLLCRYRFLIVVPMMFLMTHCAPFVKKYVKKDVMLYYFLHVIMFFIRVRIMCIYKMSIIDIPEIVHVV